MRHNFGVLAALLLALPVNSVAEVRIHAQSLRSNADMVLAPLTGKLTTSPASPSELTAINHFAISDRKLTYYGQTHLKADEILTQVAADGIDIVVFRVEKNTLGNPLAFIAGHPKQVSTIIVAGFRAGQVMWQRRIAKEAYSTQWHASITSPEV